MYLTNPFHSTTYRNGGSPHGRTKWKQTLRRPRKSSTSHNKEQRGKCVCACVSTRSIRIRTAKETLPIFYLFSMARWSPLLATT
jgi:hypothetical protein